MSTRGAIVRATPDGFVGRYHHWDSYPEGLGKTLWHLYREQFGRDLDRMLTVLIDEHPAGWSTINDKNFSLEPGFTESYNPELPPRPDFRLREEGYQKAYLAFESHPLNARPQCYCHGDRAEEGQTITSASASGMGCEYVYAFDAASRTMFVLSSYTKVEGKDVKMIGMFGAGDPNGTWKPVVGIPLDADEEPDWKQIQAACIGEAVEEVA